MGLSDLLFLAQVRIKLYHWFLEIANDICFLQSNMEAVGVLWMKYLYYETGVVRDVRDVRDVRCVGLFSSFP